MGTSFGRRKARYLVGEIGRINSLDVINEVDEDHIPDKKMDIGDNKKPHREIHSQRLESCRRRKDSSDFVVEELCGRGGPTEISI